MELHLTPRLKPKAAPAAACERYVDRLPVSPDQRRELLDDPLVREAGAHAEAAIPALHRKLAARDVETSAGAGYASIERRLGLA